MGINIDDLTLGQLKHLSAIASLLPPADSQAKPHPAIGKYCVIRTYSAGVHVGIVDYVDGMNITLSNSRRIHSWKGALSCSEIAMNGVDPAGSKVAIVLPKHYLTQAVEIIPATKACEERINQCHGV